MRTMAKKETKQKRIKQNEIKSEILAVVSRCWLFVKFSALFHFPSIHSFVHRSFRAEFFNYVWQQWHYHFKEEKIAGFYFEFILSVLLYIRNSNPFSIFVSLLLASFQRNALAIANSFFSLLVVVSTINTIDLCKNLYSCCPAMHLCSRAFNLKCKIEIDICGFIEEWKMCLWWAKSQLVHATSEIKRARLIWLLSISIIVWHFIWPFSVINFCDFMKVKLMHFCERWNTKWNNVNGVHTSKAKKRNDDDNDVGLNEHTKCIIPPINVNTIMLLHAHFGQIAIEFQFKVD